MAKIGIYGGSFNPPHLGHMLAARQCMELLGLDRVILVPAAIPPHKTLAEGSADGEARLRMTELASEGLESFTVSRIELDRAGPSYTVDTLRSFRAQYPGDQLYLLMGTDMFLSFLTWRQPEVIASLAAVVCMARVRADKALRSQLLAQKAAIRETLGAEPIVLDNDCLEVSSTQVRRLLFFGLTDGLLDPRVRDYILQNGLYGTHQDCRGLPYEALERVSLSLHKAKRRSHALGVAQTAAELAERYGADVTDARRAGILHDVTKALEPEEQRALCAKWQLPVTPFELEQAKLLHAKTGAAAADRLFGENEAVCTAISYHTTGRAGMTLLEKILYIADYIEPCRDFPGVEELRAATRRDLDEGVLLGIQTTLDLLQSRGQPACSDSLEARAWLMETGRRSRGAEEPTP